MKLVRFFNYAGMLNSVWMKLAWPHVQIFLTLSTFRYMNMLLSIIMIILVTSLTEVLWTRKLNCCYFGPQMTWHQPLYFFIFFNYPSIMCYRVCFNNFFYLTNNLRTKEHLLIIVIFVTFYLINLSTFYISNLSHFVCKWVWGKLRKSH